MSEAPFPIVGVGASAGGVEALEGLFRGLPPDPGIALVVVTHLSPERKSLLPEIIGRYTRLPVHVAQDGVPVEPNHVYVLPAGAILGIRAGRLQITTANKLRRERKPVDVFFGALAADQGEFAAGIVLSGGDSDGTLGVKAIKERGGLTLAQIADDHGPQRPDMPQSAIATGYVDFAIPAGQMGARLAEFARSARPNGQAAPDTPYPAPSLEAAPTRVRPQPTIEAYETALKQLKSFNEELVSLNEELHTVNAELSVKVEELDRANSDLENLFASTGIATVFLDSRLRIRSFTRATAQIFNLLPSDRGRPITDLASRLSLPGFSNDIAGVLATGDPAERAVENPDGSAHYLIRLTPYRDGDERQKGVVISFLDVTGLTKAESRQRVLISELQHRTRNLLAVVQAIARQTLGNGASLDAYTDRLAALGRVQGLISRAVGERIDLGAIVHRELAALAAEDGRVTIEGPPAPIGPAAAQTFALALHELATNALKYGALKEEQGRLEVTWNVEPHADGTACLALTWRESGVAMPPDPPRRGYGRQLIEDALAYNLGARTELRFAPDGVSCRIEMPLPAPDRPP